MTTRIDVLKTDALNAGKFAYDYEHLRDDLQERLASGEWPRRLPSMTALASEYGVSQQTTARAFKLLAEGGQVIILGGKGTFRA